MGIIRLRYLFALVVAILVSPFLVFWAWSSIEASRLDRAFDDLQARHEPLDLAEFDPKPVTDEQRQASHYYKQASALVADLGPRWLTETARLIEDFCRTPDPVTRTGREASLESLEDRYKPALDLLDRATLLDANGWDAKDKPDRTSIEANLPYELAGVNAARVARLACRGDGEAAANALLATLRLLRVIPRWARRPVLTGHSLQLVLQAGAPAVLLEELQHEFLRISDDSRLDVGLQHARAQWLYWAEPGVFSDPPAGVDARRMTPFEAIGARLLRPARDHVAVSEIREFDEVIDAVKLPWPQKLDAARRLDTKYPRRSNRGSVVSALARPLGPHAANSILQLHVNIVADGLARTRAGIAALGVARWRADHGGALPSSLTVLIPQYVPTMPVDPYSGGDLRYVSRGDSYKVYSLGTNRRDDGGNWEQRSDLQPARRGDPLDIGIAVISSPKLP
jgi:hypothetical protein